MGITKEECLSIGYKEIHYTGKRPCTRTIGPRGGITEKITRVRASGKCQTWKRDPGRFHLPVKYGLYESGWIDQTNCKDFHLAVNCPLNNEKD
jgi:hypothetical protein